MRRREFLAVAGAALTVPVVRLTGVAAAGTAPALHRRAGHPQLRRVRRRRRARLRHRRLVQVRQAHSDVGRAGGPGAGERQGRRGEREDRPALRQHHQADVRIDLLTEKMVWERGARGRLRPHGDLAGRQDALRAVARGPALERRRRAGRRRHHEDRDRLRRAQHGLLAATAAARTSPACSRRCCRSRTRRRTRSSRPSARSATSIRPFTVNGAQTLCFVNVNELLGFEIGDLTTGKMLHRVEVTGLREGPGQAARLPQPRRRPDAGREGAVAVRRPQQRRARLRQHRDAAEADVDAQGARSARLGDVQHRRQARVSVDRRGVRYPSKKLIASLKDEKGRRDRQREAARDRLRRAEAGAERRPVRHRLAQIVRQRLVPAASFEQAAPR